MVVLSRPVVDDFSPIKTCKPPPALFAGIPVVDLADPAAKTRIVEACKEFGFFKLINHGVPTELISRLEADAFKFFSRPQPEKDKTGPPSPLGYGNRKIGPNGDVGWIEYLLFSTTPEFISQISLSISPENPENFRRVVNDYISNVRQMVCELLELAAEGLEIEPRNVFSRLLKDEKSDSFFRLNHYPPCPELQALSGRNLIGFGEHTDPQIMSALRSNNTAGLQISLRDGTWVSVPPDHHSFFINVGDSLQDAIVSPHRALPILPLFGLDAHKTRANSKVMTNGRFRSVKHRALADSLKHRLSMIYFGGPPMSEKIAPLDALMEEGEERLYKEFTWCEYKASAYKSRLADNRLGSFEIQKKN